MARMHHSLHYNGHIWEWFFHMYRTGEDGFKLCADKCGVSRSAAATRLRAKGFPKKIHASTRKKLSGVKAINELKQRWAHLLERVRRPYRRAKTPMERYYANHAVNKERQKINAKRAYDAKKNDPVFMAQRNKRHREYRKANPEVFAKSNRKWYARNKEKVYQIAKRWRAKNPHSVRLYGRQRDKQPYRILMQRLRNRMRDIVALGKAERQSIRKFVGCTPAQLVQHIESQFTTGMGWHNRHEWHVDHIKPCALFDLNDPIQLSQCWHWTNLQPLWAGDNIAKGAKYHATYQTNA